MCIFRQPAYTPPPAAVEPTQPAPAPVAPPPPAPPAPAPVYGTSYASSGAVDAQGNPVMQNIYDPSNPESGVSAEKGATLRKARGTSQLRVDLDPVVANMAKQTGLQINK